jgi:UDP-3-O-[3-hydroxymyristoyl] glucosamine N-acyltransferase
LAATLKDIAQSIGGEVIGDDKTPITGINSLDHAVPGEISFYYDRRYKVSLIKTRASALVVSKVSDLFSGPQIVVQNPSLAHARLAALFSPPEPVFSGISPEAILDDTAVIGSNVSIYPLVYVGRDTMIGDDATLFPGVFIGDRVKIGKRTVIHPNVSILHDCIIGEAVIIHAGTVIGSDGFGFVRHGTGHVKVPQIGIVQIDDGVEIGANNTIDRATMGKTWIKASVKTDNMVHVGHNVIIGENSIIVAQTALAGSVHVGKDVIIGGQVAISDHVKIENGVMIGSQSGVPKSIEKGQVVSGTPAMPHKLWLKTSRLIKRLPQLNDRLRELEKKLAKFEKS